MQLSFLSTFLSLSLSFFLERKHIADQVEAKVQLIKTVVSRSPRPDQNRKSTFNKSSRSLTRSASVPTLCVSISPLEGSSRRLAEFDDFDSFIEVQDVDDDDEALTGKNQDSATARTFSTNGASSKSILSEIHSTRVNVV